MSNSETQPDKNSWAGVWRRCRKRRGGGTGEGKGERGRKGFGGDKGVVGGKGIGGEKGVGEGKGGVKEQR